jgi:hypothetical protein
VNCHKPFQSAGLDNPAYTLRRTLPKEEFYVFFYHEGIGKKDKNG